MSTARSHPFVPLEEFLEMVPEEGTHLEWCAGLVHAMSGESPEHARLVAQVEEYVLVSSGERRIEIRRRGARGWSSEVVTDDATFTIHGRTIAVDAIYG